MPQKGILKIRADGGTWTRTSVMLTWTWIMRVCQFRHICMSCAWHAEYISITTFRCQQLFYFFLPNRKSPFSFARTGENKRSELFNKKSSDLCSSAGKGTWTLTSYGNMILSHACLPIPAFPHVSWDKDSHIRHACYYIIKRAVCKYPNEKTFGALAWKPLEMLLASHDFSEGFPGKKLRQKQGGKKPEAAEQFAPRSSEAYEVQSSDQIGSRSPPAVRG